MSALSLPHPLRPYALNRDTAPAFWALGILWLPLATGMQTGNRLVLLEQVFAAGPGPAAHYHPYDEGFYILEGAFTFRAGGDTFAAGPGTFVHIPRLMPHSFTVDAGPVRALNVYPFAGFDLLIMSLGQPAPARRIPTLAEAPLPPPDQVEILFQLFGHTDVHPRSGPPQAADYATQPAAWSPSAGYRTTAAQSPTYAALGSQWTLLAGSAHTAGSYALLEQVLPARATTAPQRHAEAEALYVLAGTLRLVLDEQVLEGPGRDVRFYSGGRRAHPDGRRGSGPVPGLLPARRLRAGHYRLWQPADGARQSDSARIRRGHSDFFRPGGYAHAGGWPTRLTGFRSRASHQESRYRAATTMSGAV